MWLRPSSPGACWFARLAPASQRLLAAYCVHKESGELTGTHPSNTCSPADPQKTLGIKLPFLVMIIKNLKKYFSFEVQVLDDKNVRRRFRASNYQVRRHAAGCQGLWTAPDPAIKAAMGRTCMCATLTAWEESGGVRTALQHMRAIQVSRHL